jgi:hypothetical protein
MWPYHTILVVRSNSSRIIIRQYHLQATIQKEDDLMEIVYAKIRSNTYVVRPRFEDSHFKDFKLWTPKLIL